MAWGTYDMWMFRGSRAWSQCGVAHRFYVLLACRKFWFSNITPSSTDSPTSEHISDSAGGRRATRYFAAAKQFDWCQHLAPKHRGRLSSKKASEECTAIYNQQTLDKMGVHLKMLRGDVEALQGRVQDYGAALGELGYTDDDDGYSYRREHEQVRRPTPCPCPSCPASPVAPVALCVS
jgi:hypothetical protein